MSTRTARVSATASPPTDSNGKLLDAVIVPRTHDLGDGFEVRRALPAAQRRMVGPFVFFDQMGPAEFRPGAGLDVRPHPHIGLATITYLFEGEILHRDSLGTVQPIRPGEVNWMTAGRGIAHSERTSPEIRARGGGLFGIQSWVALPRDKEESDPAFAHHGAGDLPVISGDGIHVRLILGSLFGERSPIKVFSEMVYADVEARNGATFTVPAEHAERALYVVAGTVQLLPGGSSLPAGQLLVLNPGVSVDFSATGGPARLMMLGGAPMDGPRHIWWNFVSSSKDRIESAKADWKAGRFGPVPGETGFIPLPESPPPSVHYP